MSTMVNTQDRTMADCDTGNRQLRCDICASLRHRRLTLSLSEMRDLIPGSQISRPTTKSLRTLLSFDLEKGL